MSCCGNKKDVNNAPKQSGNHRAIRASKVLGVDDNIQNQQVTKGFVPIRDPRITGGEKFTRPEDYSRQHTEGSRSRLVANTNQLNFHLDEQPGVSNTFDVPSFDYQTMLQHNIFYNLNTKSKIVVNDGNVSRIGA